MSELALDRQQQRLQYIDLCAYVLGAVNRKILMNRFDIKEAWATRDFTTYQKLSGDRLVYDHSLRAYKPVDWFSPIFEHRALNAIQLIANGTQNILCEEKFANESNTYSINSVEPDLINIHSVLQALHLKKKVEITYVSRSSGERTRLIAPHSLIMTGNFQYVRAFDHQSGEFRSFKLNRIITSKIVELEPSEEQRKQADDEWNVNVELTIAINDKVEHKEAIEFDFGLKNGKLVVEIKKAMVFYFLMDWNIAPTEYDNLPATLFPLRLVSVLDCP